nr:glycosyltransferase family 4 protein [uncultured Sellimonas sp.]
MKGYIFISNSSRPTEEERKSREKVRITNFSKPCLEKALELGYKVFYGVNRDNPEELESELPIYFYDSHTYRSILDLKNNYIAYKNMIKLIQKENIDVIHCNTPVGGIIGRICGKKGNVNKVIYTVHGFHFYKGAPLINRTIFKMSEWIMAHWTDVIVTINQEDYEAAKKFRLKKNGKVYKINGVGIDTQEYGISSQERKKIRNKLGFKEEDFICISVGDLVKNKNLTTLIRAISLLKGENIHYVVCGKGPEEKNLRQLAKNLGVEGKVHFMGFRKDIKNLLGISDCFLMSSKREGLPRSVMEAMATGIPCIVSDIRGNIDLIENNENGFLCEPNDYVNFARAIVKIQNDKNIVKKFRINNLKKIKKYDSKIVRKQIGNIYEEIL